MEDARSKYQREFDALPEWAQKLVIAAQTCGCYGSHDASDIKVGMTTEAQAKYANDAFHALFGVEANRIWFEGFCDLREFAGALTAPWPKPAPPAREKRAFNIVELIDDDEDGGFDQPCCFANRVGGHATYCHNEAWPNSPSKCRRGWDDTWLECPGFVANPDFIEDHDTGDKTE